MNRIIFLLLTLQILLTSVCNAFEPPTDKRWLWLGSTDKAGCWLDTASTRYVIDDSYKHKNHKQVIVWILFYNAEKNSQSRHLVTCDISCEQYKITQALIYDAQDNIIDSINADFMNFESIPPETFAETIFIACQKLWYTDPRNDNLK